MTEIEASPKSLKLRDVKERKSVKDTISWKMLVEATTMKEEKFVIFFFFHQDIILHDVA
jgi:hypothetical protein